MQNRLIAFLSALSFIMSMVATSPVWAIDDGALARLLVRKGVITEAELSELEGELASAREKRDERVKTIAREASGIPKWAQKIKISGDIRVRNEYRDRTAATDVNRQRIRFRLGVESDITDELKMGARFASGSVDSATSTNQTLDEAFDKKEFNLDRAYLAYMPKLESVDKLKLTAGIMGQPFWKVSLLTWDGDLSFAGVAGQAEHQLGPLGTFLNAGVFPLDDASGTDNPSLWLVQIGASAQPFEGSDSKFLDALKIKSAVGYYDYKNSVGNSLTDRVSTNSSGVKDFNEINPSLEIASKIGDIPVKGYADYVHNASAGKNDDGYLVGIKVGKAKEPWSLTKGWEAGYFYERIETDAAFDSFVDSDFGNGGTNHKGHVVYGKMSVIKNSTLGVKLFDTKEISGSKNHTDTVQVDWVSTF